MDTEIEDQALVMAVKVGMVTVKARVDLTPMVVETVVVVVMAATTHPLLLLVAQ